MEDHFSSLIDVKKVDFAIKSRAIRSRVMPVQSQAVTLDEELPSVLESDCNADDIYNQVCQAQSSLSNAWQLNQKIISLPKVSVTSLFSVNHLNEINGALDDAGVSVRETLAELIKTQQITLAALSEANSEINRLFNAIRHLENRLNDQR